MPLVTNEQNEKKESTFLKYEPENSLIIRSNLYKVSSHYLKQQNKFVACHKENCMYCESGIQKKVEYNYWVNLNGQEGVVDIKPSVFFAICAIEKASKKDKRNISWLVIKTGSGLETEYTVSKDDNLAPEDVKKSEAELESFNEKLTKLMSLREENLEKAYREYAGNKIEEQITEDLVSEEKNKKEFNPEDVPDF